MKNNKTNIPYELDKVYCLDCFKFMSSMPDECVDLIVADYPFSYYYNDELEKVTDRELVHSFVQKTATEFWRILKPDTNLAVVMQSIPAYGCMRFFSELFEVRNIVVLKGPIIWSWANLPFNYNFLLLLFKGQRSEKWKRIDGLTDYWEYSGGTRIQNEQLPSTVAERVILMTTEVGDLVFDPFAGSGNIDVVAKRLGRRFLACDASPKCVNLANRRVSGWQPKLFE